MAQLGRQRPEWLELGPSREVELSATRARMASWEHGQDGRRGALWHLPASSLPWWPEDRLVHTVAVYAWLGSSCLYCSVAGQLSRPRRLFTERLTDGVPDWKLLLFSTAEGSVVTEVSMAASFAHAAVKLGLPKESRTCRLVSVGFHCRLLALSSSLPSVQSRVLRSRTPFSKLPQPSGCLQSILSVCLLVTCDADKWHRLAREGLASACGWRGAGPPAAVGQAPGAAPSQ